MARAADREQTGVDEGSGVARVGWGGGFSGSVCAWWSGLVACSAGWVAAGVGVSAAGGGGSGLAVGWGAGSFGGWSLFDKRSDGAWARRYSQCATSKAKASGRIYPKRSDYA